MSFSRRSAPLLRPFAAARPLPNNIRTPFARQFHASKPVMTISSYFDLEWEGPVVEIDDAGNVTKVDKTVKSASPVGDVFTSMLTLTVHRAERPHQLQPVRRRRPQDR